MLYYIQRIQKISTKANFLYQVLRSIFEGKKLFLVKYNVPLQGQRYFWNLHGLHPSKSHQDVLKTAKRSWLQMCQHIFTDVSKSFLWPQASKEGQADVQHTMHEVCGNTSVMLLIALTLATSGKKNRVTGQQWLQRLVDRFASNGTLRVKLPTEGEPTVDVRLRNGQVSLADVAASLSGRKSNTRGLRLRSERSVATFLAAIRLKSEWAWLLKSLLLQLAVLVEQNLESVTFGEADVSLAYGFHRDPVQRVLNVRMAQQKAWRSKRQKRDQKAKQAERQPGMSKEARSKARARVASLREMVTRRDKQRERSLYFQECQDQFRNARQLSVSFDASRVGGRKLTSFAVVNLQSGVSAWAPSQARAATGDCNC